jgi:hypothetical protein
VSRIACSGDTGWQDDPARPPACRTPDAMGSRQFDSIDYEREETRSAWERIRRAIRVCDTCPVVAECLAHALDPNHGVEGVWGARYFTATDPNAYARGVRRSFLPPLRGSDVRRPLPV